jgi:hypothetical protein
MVPPATQFAQQYLQQHLQLVPTVPAQQQQPQILHLPPQQPIQLPQQLQEQPLVLAQVSTNFQDQYNRNYVVPQSQNNAQDQPQILHIPQQQPAQQEYTNSRGNGRFRGRGRGRGGFNNANYNNGPQRYCSFCQSNFHNTDDCMKRSVSELATRVSELTQRQAQMPYAPQPQLTYAPQPQLTYAPTPQLTYPQQQQAAPGNAQQQPTITYPAAGNPQGRN